MFDIGQRVVVYPINYAKKKVDRNHIYYRKHGVILEKGTLNRYIVAMDDFPDCNHRERFNRFCYNEEELKEEKIK